MKLRASIFLSAASLALLGTATAQGASPPTHPTTASIDSVHSSGLEQVVLGSVASPRAGCIAGRTVKIFAHYRDGHTELLDVTTTERRGYFYGGGITSSSLDRIVVRVTKRRIGSKLHPHVCLPAKAFQIFV